MVRGVSEAGVVASVVEVTKAVDGVHRVACGGSTVGYVLEAGPVYVALRGTVYNTSLEVAQARDLDTAVRALAR